MGVSAWKQNPFRKISPEGTAGTSIHADSCRPFGALRSVGHPIHGFAPVAATCRPFGTNVLVPGRVDRAGVIQGVALG